MIISLFVSLTGAIQSCLIIQRCSQLAAPNIRGVFGWDWRRKDGQSEHKAFDAKTISLIVWFGSIDLIWAFATLWRCRHQHQLAHYNWKKASIYEPGSQFPSPPPPMVWSPRPRPGGGSGPSLPFLPPSPPPTTPIPTTPTTPTTTTPPAPPTTPTPTTPTTPPTPPTTPTPTTTTTTTSSSSSSSSSSTSTSKPNYVCTHVCPHHRPQGGEDTLEGGGGGGQWNLAHICIRAWLARKNIQKSIRGS